MKNNGRAKKVEDVVEAVMDALQDRSENAQDEAESRVKAATATAGEKLSDAGETVSEKAGVVAEKAGAAGEKIAAAAGTASEKLKDADVSAKVDRVLDLIEENAAVFATVAKRLTGEAAKQAPAVAAKVGEMAGEAAEAAGEAAESAGEAASGVIETIGEELIQPVTRYGRGLRHGLVVGAAIAIVLTPWPGRVVREKLKSGFQEAADLVNALREGADTSTY
jgi:gas vesicle protein